jgi:hypothetical protein
MTISKRERMREGTLPGAGLAAVRPPARPGSISNFSPALALNGAGLGGGRTTAFPIMPDRGLSLASAR